MVDYRDIPVTLNRYYLLDWWWYLLLGPQSIGRAADLGPQSCKAASRRNLNGAVVAHVLGFLYQGHRLHWMKGACSTS